MGYSKHLYENLRTFFFFKILSRDWVEVIELTGREHSYTVPNLKEGDQVSFRIRAVNTVGPSEPSRATDTITVEDQPGKIDQDFSSQIGIIQ